MDYCGESIYTPDKSGNKVVSCNISMTDSAVKELTKIINEDNLWLYVSVQGGGCSGYIYALDLEPPQDDTSLQTQMFENICIAIHDLDSVMLNGLEIDYSYELMGGGFKIQNPNATKSCSCGLSFK
tara:strand:- start:504 stop:881 length:378 start_codon:yes stop_codon:yes gene_type:complete